MITGFGVSSGTNTLLGGDPGPWSKAMTRMSRVATLFAFFFFAASCAPKDDAPRADSELQRLAARAAGIEIIRDNYGVPHVYGKTDADAVFGMLYAQAEDDFPRVERNYIWATGRLAEVDGEAAIFSDVRARLYMTVDEAKAAYDAAPDWLRALCDAFADGLNYYLATHPDVKTALRSVTTRRSNRIRISSASATTKSCGRKRSPKRCHSCPASK